MALFLFALTTGCEPRVFYSSTRLHSDGSLERVIYQPASDTPAEAMLPGTWDSMNYAPSDLPSKTAWKLRELPHRNLDEKYPYFVGIGRFPSAEALPRHFSKSTPELPQEEDTSRTSTLVQDLKRTDYGFIVELDWRETLSDIVSLPDIHKAQQELSLLATQVAIEALQNRLGKEYDVTELQKWMSEECAQALSESVDIFYEHAVRTGNKSHDVVKVRLAKNAQKYGLNLLAPDGTLLEQEAATPVLREFAAARLRQSLKRRDGEPIPDAIMGELLDEMGLRVGPETPDGQEPPPNPLETAVNEVLNRRFGGSEAFQQHAMRLAKRILGAHQSELLGPPRPFHYTMEVPGFIVATNGDLQSDQEVSWSFDAREAYPLGFEMHCRSLLPVTDLQKKLLAGEPLRTRADCLQFVQLLSADDTLREVIQNVIAEGKLAPLFRYYQSVSAAGDAEKLERLEKLWKILKLHRDRVEVEGPTPASWPEHGAT